MSIEDRFEFEIIESENRKAGSAHVGVRATDKETGLNASFTKYST